MIITRTPLRISFAGGGSELHALGARVTLIAYLPFVLIILLANWAMKTSVVRRFLMDEPDRRRSGRSRRVPGGRQRRHFIVCGRPLR